MPTPYSHLREYRQNSWRITSVSKRNLLGMGSAKLIRMGGVWGVLLEGLGFCSVRFSRGSSVDTVPVAVRRTCLSCYSEEVFLRVRRGCQASQRKRPTSGEVTGKLPGNLWNATKVHTGRTSGEVAREVPAELPGKSGAFTEARGSLTPSQRLAKFVSKLPFPPHCQAAGLQMLLPCQSWLSVSLAALAVALAAVVAGM